MKTHIFNKVYHLLQIICGIIDSIFKLVGNFVFAILKDIIKSNQSLMYLMGLTISHYIYVTTLIS